MARNSKLLSIYILFTCVLSAGCASKNLDKVACEQKDWYEIGRHDGAQGSPLETTKRYREECGQQFSSHFETMYNNGRNAGLVEYCSPDNGRELGRMGITYNYVCPSTTEPSFLIGYRKGQTARRIELENEKLDAEIDGLLAKIKKSSAPQKRQLASEIDVLRKTRLKNEKELRASE